MANTKKKTVTNNRFDRFDDEAIGYFKMYLEDPEFTLTDLIKCLGGIEYNICKVAKKGKNKSIWFRMFKGDTLATDLTDLRRALESYHANTREHMREAIQTGVDTQGIEVYYS